MARKSKAAAASALEGTIAQDMESVRKLTRDLKTAAKTLTDREARYLVDSYYAIQDYRIQAADQARRAGKAGEPHAVLEWLGGNMETLEGQIKTALGVYAESRRAGRWALSQVGIGPVIAAGLLAHIQVRREVQLEDEKGEKMLGKDGQPLTQEVITYTAGAIWKFAGLDPTVVWEKGQKRPWNAKLKVLCWKIGQSFMKFSNNDECWYGKVYKKRKALEVERNQKLMFADQAKLKLEKFKIRDQKTKATYESGMLPDGRIELRAERYAVKLFLSHFHHVLFEEEFKQPPPKPYVIEHLGHAEYFGPPNWPCE